MEQTSKNNKTLLTRVLSWSIPSLLGGLIAWVMDPLQVNPDVYYRGLVSWFSCFL